ncbi:putative Ig domain-containing protein, partial [Shewanella mangrovisoli]
TDVDGLTADQSFTIVVANVNDVPTISSTALTSATQDAAYSYTLVATDSDVGDSLTLSAVTLPSWLSFNAATGVLSG